jgi:hypothetical protein
MFIITEETAELISRSAKPERVSRSRRRSLENSVNDQFVDVVASGSGVT